MFHVMYLWCAFHSLEYVHLCTYGWYVSRDQTLKIMGAFVLKIYLYNFYIFGARRCCVNWKWIRASSSLLYMSLVSCITFTFQAWKRRRRRSRQYWMNVIGGESITIMKEKGGRRKVIIPIYQKKQLQSLFHNHTLSSLLTRIMTMYPPLH